MRKKWNDSDPEYRDGKRLGKKARALVRQSRRPFFRCVHCKNEISIDAVGTKHRNHCPVCLWSRHVDNSIGDRKSNCLASIRPLGLSLKENGGEIMIVHWCVKCHKISRNRIAADDNTTSILDLLKSSLDIDAKILGLIKSKGIKLCLDKATIEHILFGKTN